MDISTKKIELIQWLSSIDDKETIEKLEEFRLKETKDWWESTSNKEKESIEKGLKDAEVGNYIPQEEARKIYEKWV